MDTNFIKAVYTNDTPELSNRNVTILTQLNGIKTIIPNDKVVLVFPQPKHSDIVLMFPGDTKDLTISVKENVDLMPWQKEQVK